MVENDLKEHSSKQAASFFYVSVSLVLWSGNHLDGRKIGHCKFKLENLLFCFGQSDDNTFLSIAFFFFFFLFLFLALPGLWVCEDEAGKIFPINNLLRN